MDINIVKQCLFHPLHDLTREEVVTVTTISLVSAVCLPILGGIVAFYVVPIVLRARHVKKISVPTLPENKVQNVASPLLTPAVTPPSAPPPEDRVRYSPETLTLLDAFGIREERGETIEEERVLSTIDFLKTTIPPDALGTWKEKPSEEILSNKAFLIGFLQTVHDYTLTLFFPMPPGIRQPSSDKSPYSDHIAYARAWIEENKGKTIPKRSNFGDITCIPLDIFELRHLQELNISSPTLLGVSSRIANFEHMERLSLKNSPHLDALPPEMSTMQKLSVLDLTGNKNLRHVPKRPPHLQLLVLKGCSSLPKEETS